MPSLLAKPARQRNGLLPRAGAAQPDRRGHAASGRGHPRGKVTETDLQHVILSSSVPPAPTAGAMSTADLAGHAGASAAKAQACMGKLRNAVRLTAVCAALAALPGPVDPSEKDSSSEALAHHRS